MSGEPNPEHRPLPISPQSSNSSSPPPNNNNSPTHHHQHHQKPQKKTNRSSLAKMTRNRLPTLQEVLARQTRPPVDLYCFYLYLQRERAEDSLDFWLDAQQHENLCRAYFKDLRKSAVDLRNEWPAYYERARARGSVYNTVNGIVRQSNLITDSQLGQNEKSMGAGGTRGSMGSHRKSGPTPSVLPSHVSPAVRALFPHDQPMGSGAGGTSTGTEGQRQSAHLSAPQRSRTPIQPVIPRSSAITRTDLIASAERIYYRYLLTGAEKEIYLPATLRIHDFPINSSSLPNAGMEDYEVESDFMARVPDLFVAQKEYIYRSMEQDTFPRFLRAKAFGNLTPMSSIVRLSLGLLAIWIGLSVAFSLIFLDHKPQAERLWILLPLTLGAIGVFGYFYEIDPILIGVNRSETTPFRTLSIKEKYVQKILRGRAIWVMIISLILAILTTTLLVLVPGYRL